MNSSYQKHYLIVLAGATAVGKTQLAITLAKKYQTVIVSADARQIYQEMSIGTAKPTEEEMQGIKHYFIHSHSIKTHISAGSYSQEAEKLLDTLFQQYNPIILVGGSGLYIKALCEGIDEIPETDENIKQQLQQELNEKGLEPLLLELQNKDPKYYQQVDKNNPARIIRALEVIRTHQTPFSNYRTQQYKPRNFQPIYLCLTRPTEELYIRIEQRIDLMLQQGLLEEAKQLYPLRNYNALKTVGYQEIFAFLDQQYDWNECLRLLKRNTRRYAKRQATWFRNQHSFEHIPIKEVHKIEQYIETNLK
ncbi:MAG: tRNA (adenosine(37)-N6)-dimethylallyltransferase MiaA [Cytophagales bacterium]|nr:MAG: tRNA (adenosine(37)-N6)-dimethylallyltransferase MiaA [Cytophagales bacterium]